MGIKLSHQLRESTIRPYIPDASLMSYEALSEDEASFEHDVPDVSQVINDEDDGTEPIEEEAYSYNVDIQPASKKRKRAPKGHRVRFADEVQQGDTDDRSYPIRKAGRKKKIGTGVGNRKKGGKGAATGAVRRPTKKQAADAAGPSIT